MHALIHNDTITHVGPLPRIWWDGDRWHDLRDDDGTYAASLGWLPITYQPRPADTHTTTWDRDEPAPVDGLPVVGWTERPKTEAELAAEAEQDARLDDLDARVARIEAHLWPPRGPEHRSAHHGTHHGRLRGHLARRWPPERRRQSLAQRHVGPAHHRPQRLPRTAEPVDAPIRGARARRLGARA